MKSTLFLSTIVFLVLILNSCGPSFCDCYEEMSKGREADQSMKEKCQEKYEHVSRSEAMKMAEQCK